MSDYALIDAEHATVNEPGTHCVTKAEDAIRDAIGRADAWRSHVREFEAPDPASIEEARGRVFLDCFEGPGEGLAFTVEELEEAGTLCMVTADPENGLTISNATAQGVTTAQTLVMAVFELSIRHYESNQPGNLIRKLKNVVNAVASEANELLVDTKGARWMQATQVVQQPCEVADEWGGEKEIIGHRLVAAILFTVGPGEDR